jgi:hypothetical protein
MSPITIAAAVLRGSAAATAPIALAPPLVETSVSGRAVADGTRFA